MKIDDTKPFERWKPRLKEGETMATSPGMHLQLTESMQRKKANRELYGKIIHQDSRVTVRLQTVGDEVIINVHVNRVAASDGKPIECLPMGYVIGHNTLRYKVEPRPERV